MKKILLILLMFAFMINIKADMGEPMMPKVKMVITNQDGAYIYKLGKKCNDDCYVKSKTIIPYDTEIAIMSEFYYKGTMYGYLVSLGDSDEEEETPYDSGFVKLKDCAVIEEKYEEPNIVPSNKKQLYIFKEEGVPIYQGPSTKFKKTGTVIPYGETATYLASEDYFPQIWVYVEYKGVRGWIYYIRDEYNGMYGEESYVAEEANFDYMLMGKSSRNIYKYPKSDKSNILGTVLKDEEVVCQYSYGNGNEWCYISKDDVSGWIYVQDYYANNMFYEKMLLIDKTYGYDYPKDGAKPSITIPANTVVDVEYSYIKRTDNNYQTAYRIEYDSKSYWVFSGDSKKQKNNVWKIDKKYIADMSFEYETSYIDEYMKRMNNVNLYENKNESGNPIAHYNNEKINAFFNYNYTHEDESNDNNWFYIVTQNYSGWFNLSEDVVDEIDHAIYNRENGENGEPNEEISDISDIWEYPDDPLISEEDTNKINYTHLTIMFLSIGGAIVLAITSAITIVLINKKKKNTDSTLINNTIEEDNSQNKE